VALFIDGRTFADTTLMVALGVTVFREKRFLDFVETDTEKERVLTPFLRSLTARGLNDSAGVLVVIDCAKGVRGAVKKAFGERTTIQCCLWHKWHKRENVVSYLSKGKQAIWR
jgi:transposase-like protein